MIQLISGGARAEPAPTPPKTMPLAIPRSPVGIQLDTSRLDAGNITASPAPSRKRTEISRNIAEATPAGTTAVSAVKKLHHRIPKVRTRLGPNRSANLPPGA